MLFGAWGESGGGGQVSAKSLGKEMGVAAAREHWLELVRGGFYCQSCVSGGIVVYRYRYVVSKSDLEFQGFESKSNSPDHPLITYS
jgi:hypothetical protein